MRNVPSSHASLALVGALVTLSAAVACSTARDEASAPPSTTTQALEPRAVLVRGGEFRFVLDESKEILAKVTEECASEKDAPACIAQIRDAGALEGMRFVPVDATHARIQSFGKHDGREEIYWEAPIAVERTEGSRVLVRVTGPREGTRVPKTPGSDTYAVEVVDAATIAMVDRKGRMVFRRAPE